MSGIENETIKKSAENAVEDLTKDFDDLANEIMGGNSSVSDKATEIQNLRDNITLGKDKLKFLQDDVINNKLNELDNKANHLENNKLIDLVHAKDWVEISKCINLDTDDPDAVTSFVKENLLEFCPNLATISVNKDDLDFSTPVENKPIQVTVEHQWTTKIIDCKYTVIWPKIKSGIKIWKSNETVNVRKILENFDKLNLEDVACNPGLDLSNTWTYTGHIELTYENGSSESKEFTYEVVQYTKKEGVTVLNGDSLQAKDFVENLEKDATVTFSWGVEPDFTKSWDVEITITYSNGTSENIPSHFDVVEIAAKPDCRVVKNCPVKAIDLFDNIPEWATVTFDDDSETFTPTTEWSIDKTVIIKYKDSFDAEKTATKSCTIESIDHIPAKAKNWVFVEKWGTLEAKDLLEDLPEGATAEFSDPTNPDFSEPWTKMVKVKVNYNDGDFEFVPCNYEVLDTWKVWAWLRKTKEQSKTWFQKVKDWFKTQREWVKDKEEWKNHTWKNTLRVAWWLWILSWIFLLWRRIFRWRDWEELIPWYENMSRREKRKARRKWRRENR